MKIKFLPTEVEVEGDPNKSLLQICTENKIEIKSICKGVPSCAECRVKIVSGEYNVLPPSKAELSLIGSSYFIDQRRLSCQVHCFGDVVVDIAEQIERGEMTSKKVRGFRLQNQKGAQAESHAKQGTLVLEENLAPPPPPPPQQPRQQQPRQQQQNRGQQPRQQQGRGQQQQRPQQSRPPQAKPQQNQQNKSDKK